MWISISSCQDYVNIDIKLSGLCEYWYQAVRIMWISISSCQDYVNIDIKLSGLCEYRDQAVRIMWISISSCQDYEYLKQKFPAHSAYFAKIKMFPSPRFWIYAPFNLKKNSLRLILLFPGSLLKRKQEKLVLSSTQ